MARKTPAKRKPVANMVSGLGTDEEIAARCEATVDGWDKISAKGKADMVRLMRHFENSPSPPAMDVLPADDELKLETPEGCNPTLNAMRMVEAMGVSSDSYLNARIADLSRYYSGTGGDGLTTQNLSAAFAMIAGGNATDPVQSALLVQMNCTHDAAIKALAKVGKSQFIPQAQMWGNLANKLFNTYARQAEALAKLQRGGEQVIKHVHIDNRGGQAVLAEQVVTGGLGAESGNQGYEPDATGPALLGSDTFGRVMPMPSREGPEAVPIARVRAGQRCAKG